MKPVPEQNPWHLNLISDLRHECFLSAPSLRPHSNILTVRYEGRYRVGSRGGPDATYMEAVATAAFTATSPRAVILDFTLLDYSWGDDLERVFDVGGDLPFALVLGKECREAVISLVCEGHTLMEPAEWMFDTFAEAWHHVDERIR